MLVYLPQNGKKALNIALTRQTEALNVVELVTDASLTIIKVNG